MERQALPKRVVVFDFDQTIADTAHLEPFRKVRDWAACERAAPTAAFYESIDQVLIRLFERGDRLYIASSAPARYLAAFTRRLPRVFVNTLSYRSATTKDGHTRRASIKLEQLGEIRRSEGSGSRFVFIGDDQDDASAAARARIPFIHACWGGTCAGVTGAHPNSTTQLDAAIDAALEV